MSYFYNFLKYKKGFNNLFLLILNINIKNNVIILSYYKFNTGN